MGVDEITGAVMGAVDCLFVGDSVPYDEHLYFALERLENKSCQTPSSPPLPDRVKMYLRYVRRLEDCLLIHRL